MVKYNYFQPIYWEYTNALTEGIAGYVMSFPNLKQFKSRYGEEQENAPTNSLLDTMRLLLPQIRVINKLVVNDEPNPAAFLAYEPIKPQILSLIFNKWIEVCYPESEHEYLKSLCTSNRFEWKPATSELLEWWSPAWAIAKELSEYENYTLGGHTFKLLFAPGRKDNTVELVSWPPFTNTRGYKSSIGVVISTQSDFTDRRINIDFQMRRWVVQRGNKLSINLQAKTTHCYVRRLTSWLGNSELPHPNAFTVLEAKNFKKENQEDNKNKKATEKENKFERRWKNKKVLEILEKLSVEIPAIENVLANPLDFIESDKTNILIPARGWQKAGWGTGFTFVDTRLLLKQILSFLPSDVTLTKPWQKISAIKDNSVIENKFKDASKSIEKQLIKNPDIHQCIVSSEKIDKKTKEITLDEQAEKSIINRALSAILDAIMLFDRNYPLSTSEDNNVYAGFYVISRNRTTSSRGFHEPALVVIYKNEIKVLLPAQDTKLRSCHWWSADECEYPVPLSLAKKIKEWCFSESNLEQL